MDEPCSALDPDRHRPGRGTDRRVARELHDRDRHALDAAGRARVAAHGLFHLGHLVEVGETTDIFTNPRHKLTEDYITGRFG